MYRLANAIPSDVALNLIPDVSFDPDGAMFAVTYQLTNEVVIFNSRTRSPVRVYSNPTAELDSPHGVLVTGSHLIVSNSHSILRPSTFTVYRLCDTSDKPVCVYTTPYPHLREAHSMALHNGILIATYCQNAEGPGAVVSYRFDDETGQISAPISMRESCFSKYGQTKGVAFYGDGSKIYCTYTTQKRHRGAANYARRLKAAWIIFRSRSVTEFFRYLLEKSHKRARVILTPERELKNGIAMFGINASGEISESPIEVKERADFCRLENIHIIGDTALLCDTINGQVVFHNLATDPRLEVPAYTLTENVTLPHGARLSPDQSMLVVTNYGLKVEDDIIHWMTPHQESQNSILVYDRVTP